MKNFGRIEKYLENKMDAEEQQSFEQEIKEKEELAIEVELQKQENIALKSTAFDLLKKNIQALDEENLVDTTEKESTAKVVEMPRRNYLKPLAVAASITLLALIGYQILKQPEQVEIVVEDPPKEEIPTEKIKESPIKEIPEEVIVKEEPKSNPPKKEVLPPKEIKKKKKRAIEKIIEPQSIDYGMIAMANVLPESDSWTRSEGVAEISNPAWKAIIEQYNLANYKEVIGLANQLNEDHPFYLDAKHIKAKSLLKSSAYSKAVVVYKELIATEDDFQMDTYQYEMLLSLLGQLPQKETEFKALYNTINSNSDFSYGDEFNKLKAAMSKVNINFE